MVKLAAGSLPWITDFWLKLEVLLPLLPCRIVALVKPMNAADILRLEALPPLPLGGTAYDDLTKVNVFVMRCFYSSFICSSVCILKTSCKPMLPSAR
jgi:hypothetical protein